MDNRPVSVGDWMVTYILLCIPIVNLILLFVWAFGTSPESKANWAKATLLWMVISGVLVGIIIAAGIGGLASM